MDIAVMLKCAREKQGLSMNALARMSGVPQSSISEIEAGKRQPSFDSVQRICLALGVSLSDFFATEAPTIDPSLSRLLQAAEKLTEVERQKLTELLITITTRSDNHE